MPNEESKSKEVKIALDNLMYKVNDNIAASNVCNLQILIKILKTANEKLLENISDTKELLRM